MIKKITMFLLVMITLIPFGVNATKKLVDVEELSDAASFGFVGRIDTDYSNFVLSNYDYETEGFILYKYDWNKNRTLLPTDFDDDNIAYGEEYGELYYVNRGGASSYGRTLSMEEDPLNAGSYRYFTSYEDNTELKSAYIYSSATKGEPLGYLLEDDDLDYILYVYQLLKTDGGADYVSDSGRIVFSADDTGYVLINHDERVNVFKNDTNIIITYYDETTNPYTISKFTVAGLKSLLETDDLTGMKITSGLVSTAGDKYIEIELNNHIYFLNPSATEILYEKEITANIEYEFYGMKYNNKDYIFLDLYETSPYHQILTEVFDLEGNRYYEDSEWINLYFTRYGALFGIEKIDNKYYATFISLDGTNLYREDITDRDDIGDFYYNFYGEILASDHDTITINEGKYLFKFNNDRVNDDEYFIDYRIMSILSSYDVIEGANQNYTLGSKKNAVFKINANKDLFNKLYINDKELDSSKYTVAKGSTIITLLPNYLNTLKKGTYELKATFTNEEIVTTNFTVIASITNPNTSDKIINFALFGTISIMGLIGSSLYLKKKRYN